MVGQDDACMSATRRNSNATQIAKDHGLEPKLRFHKRTLKRNESSSGCGIMKKKNNHKSSCSKVTSVLRQSVSTGNTFKNTILLKGTWLQQKDWESHC